MLSCNGLQTPCAIDGSITSVKDLSLLWAHVLLMDFASSLSGQEAMLGF